MARSAVFLAIFALAGGVAAQTCNTGGIYSAQFNRCYQYFTAPAQFEFAEEQCNLLGGHLASVQNGQENALIQSNAANSFKKSNYSDYWIGANDLETSGTWKWTDPSVTWNYQNWQLGEPQSGSDCAIQDKGDGTWSAIGCTSYRPYVCVTPVIVTATCPPITTPAPTTCPTPAPCPVKNCVPSCDQGWTYFAPTDFCYRVYHNAKWDDAEAACVLLGAHLTSVHSETENTFVANLASCGIKEGNPKDLAWIGMHKVGQDWVWTDGTKSDYINWAPKQPDNPGKENCVETAPDLSHDKWYENWNNEACSTEMRAYICKKGSIHV
ncbi:CRE-CLEC-50 protein [Caenorhabditis remanei]|uniref:CRE-CLEC-50 protein n=1 Tax=Caenorhabditis remanei TaxID=31234 RepID=E3N8J7_CAERE|nr:CRE-CLEC-50 protein [Caenorhabditis remanei]